MFDSDQGILKIIEEALDESVICGYDEYYNAAEAIKEVTLDKVKQHIELMQMKIDDLMLEYCPSEMTQEQLNNWAKHQEADNEVEQHRS